MRVLQGVWEGEELLWVLQLQDPARCSVLLQDELSSGRGRLKAPGESSSSSHLPGRGRQFPLAELSPPARAPKWPHGHPARQGWLGWLGLCSSRHRCMPSPAGHSQPGSISTDPLLGHLTPLSPLCPPLLPIFPEPSRAGNAHSQPDKRKALLCIWKLNGSFKYC